MRVEPVTGHISLVHGEKDGVFPGSHSILILGEETVLVDTGCGIKDLKQLRDEYDVSYVINSHTHPDHSAGNWVFGDRPIHVPEEGFDTSGDDIALAGRFVGREVSAVFRDFIKKAMGFRNCRPTNSYNGRIVFDFGGTTLEPIYTPGHTKDHYCFFEPGEGILFSFDYDLTSFPWYGHRESSIPQFRESVEQLKALCPKAVVPSHREIVTEDIAAEFDNFCQILDKRAERILSLLGGGKNLAQLVECAPIYGSFPYAEPLLRYWEGKMIAKHLEQLELDGMVKRHGDLYFKN
jgi:glyoxylase-like metal-dependent hydrolase (beta-lactamase superfamily II)